MKTVPKYSPEVRERAVRMVFEHQVHFPDQRERRIRRNVNTESGAT
jgi:transposase-like protein